MSVKLRDDQWEKLHGFVQGHPGVYAGQSEDCRRFLEAVLWIAKSGAQWRLLPAEYGNWNSVYKRFQRWSERSVWQAMFEVFADDPDMRELMLDSSVIRAHASAAGAPAKRGDKTRKPSDAAKAGSAPRFTS